MLTNRPSLILRSLRYAYALSRTLQVLIIVGALINSFLINLYTVSGRSMQPTLQSGEHILVNKMAYLLHKPALDDIVVIHYGSDGQVNIVKRITGLPGSRQLVNGAWITLASDEYFVTGDNPRQSTDSRIFGPIKQQEIVGRLLTRLNLAFLVPES